MTLQQFTQAYNLKRSQMNPPRHAVTFPLMKSKITKKREQTWGVDGNGVPVLISEVKAVSKQVVDTNSITKLYQAMFEYFLGVELKRISSEGKYRHGIGYIKNTNKGFADLHGMYQGKAIYIEVKQSKEKMLPSQIEFKQWVESGGGIYRTIRCYEEMFSFINELSPTNIVHSSQ